MPGDRPRQHPPERQGTDRRRYDLYSRFAEQHLRTRTERAVYLTLVAQMAPTWTAEALARSKGLDSGEVRAVLDRHLDAGVVERAEGPGRRYRWRSDMDYLGQGAQPDAWLLDPVCGMPVDPCSPHRTQDASHRVTLFCAASCLAVFQRRGVRHDHATG